MARDLYGIPNEVLLERLRAAQEELMRGKSLVSFGNESGNSAQQIIVNARTVIREIFAELTARGHPDYPADVTRTIDFVGVSFQ